MPHRLIAALTSETTDTSTKLTISYSLLGEDGERHESHLILANEEAEYGPYIRARFDQFLSELGFAPANQEATSADEQPKAEPAPEQQPATGGENVVSITSTQTWRRRGAVAASLAVGAVALTSVAASALDRDGDGVVSYRDLMATLVDMAPKAGIQESRVLDVHGVPHTLYWRVDRTDPQHPARLITMVAEPTTAK